MRGLWTQCNTLTSVKEACRESIFQLTSGAPKLEVFESPHGDYADSAIWVCETALWGNLFNHHLVSLSDLQVLQGEGPYTQPCPTKLWGNHLQLKSCFSKLDSVWKPTWGTMREVPSSQLWNHSVMKPPCNHHLISLVQKCLIWKLMHVPVRKRHVLNSVKQHCGINIFRLTSCFSKLGVFADQCWGLWGNWYKPDSVKNTVEKPSFQVTPSVC